MKERKQCAEIIGKEERQCLRAAQQDDNYCFQHLYHQCVKIVVAANGGWHKEWRQCSRPAQRGSSYCFQHDETTGSNRSYGSLQNPYRGYGNRN